MKISIIIKFDERPDTECRAAPQTSGFVITFHSEIAQ